MRSNVINVLKGLFILVFGIAGCGGGGGANNSGTTGNTPPTPLAATVNLSASNSQGFIGSQITLTWSSENSTSCTASGDWTGSRNTTGTEQVTISANSVYTLACTGLGGTAQSSRTVIALPEPFDSFYSRLQTIFTKDTFETTDTFLARVSGELLQAKTYVTQSTNSTHNVFGSSYDADTQQATINFGLNCQGGDSGEVCAPAGSILMNEVHGTTINNMYSDTQYIVKLVNSQEITSNLKIPMSANNARELPDAFVVLTFRFPSSTVVTNPLVLESFRIPTRSGWVYYYSYPEIVAIVDKITFISRTTGRELSTISLN